MPYRYGQGDRPLDGFTIEYGLGRGGFGEVYYAVSDSGREVALKAVQNFEDIELRGIRHCMNLKSPHLVTIFDVRHNDRGEPFVIMEYVAGPSLRDLLDDAPEGLGETKAAFFLREIAKGLAYLHDNGIVHRDLKPHNVFYEDGFVKIGDYSLSKLLSTSHRSGHTKTVGTVHYMAPEISMGRYDSCVDIYALGIILYEMIKGQPPFVGESMGEVLIKHVTAEVDISDVPEPFASVILKALAKNPDERFQSATEMAAAVFGAQHIDESVAEFNPQNLTQVAQQAGRKVVAATMAPKLGETPGRSAAETPTEYHPDSGKPESDDHLAYRVGRDVGRFGFHTFPTAAYGAGRNFGLVAAHTGLRFYPRRVSLDTIDDPVSHRRRVTCAVLSAAVMAVATTVGCGGHSALGVWISALAIILGGSMGIVAAGRWLASSHHHRHGFFRRIFLAIVAVLGAWIGLLVGRIMGGEANGLLVKSAMTTPFLTLVLLDWRALFSPIRRARLSIMPVITAAAIAALLAAWLGGNPVVAASVAAGMALTVQAGTPFTPVTEQEILEHNRAQEQAAAQPFKAAVAHRPPSEPKPQPLAQAAIAQPVQAEPPLAREPGTTFSGESTRSRSVALLLCAVPLVFPVCGLQRFYAGKIGTGVLYLLTFGLCSIGQLIDGILIIMGQFTDEEGRLITSWPGHVVSGPTMSTPVNAWSSVPARGSLGPSLASLLGLTLIAVGCLLALGLNAPEAIVQFETHGVMDTDIHGELTRALGIEDWPTWLMKPAIVSIALVFAVGVTLLLMGRRRFGPAHMLRGVLGTAICIGALVLVNVVCQKTDWNQMAVLLSEHQVAAAIDSVLDSDEHVFALITSCIVLLTGFIVLSWPPAPFKPQTAPARPAEQEVLS